MSRAPRLGFVPGFDGIRGLGIAMVLYEHALSDSKIGAFSFSPIVDLFFVLSGFLIVTLLLQEDRANGHIGLRNFYTRRALRLLPSVWLYLLVMIGLAALFARNILGEVLKDAAAAFFYVYNLFYPPGTAAFRPDIAAQRSMSQLWTLSLEEQFYMVIGVVIVVCIARRWVKSLAVVATLLAIFIQWCRATQHFGPFLIVSQRPDALLMGAVLAIVNAHWAELSDRACRILKWVAGVALVVGVLTMLSSSALVRTLGGPYVESYPAHFTAFTATVFGQLERFTPSPTYEPGRTYFFEYGYTVVIWMALPFVLALVRLPTWGVNRVLSRRPFRYMGRLSYSLYIWHGIGILVAMSLIPHAGSTSVALTRAVICWVVSFAVAIPVYKYVELRFNRLKLGYAAERTVIDLSTGEEVDIEDPNTRGSPR